MSQAIATRGFVSSSYTAEAATADTTAPTWDTTTGIVSLTQRLDGGLTITWGTATDDQGGTVLYNIYVKALNATNLFTSANFLGRFPGTTTVIDRLPSSTDELASNTLYYVGIRAVDTSDNEDTNVISLSATTTGISPTATIRKKIKEVLASSVLSSTDSTIQLLKNRFYYGDLAGLNRATQYPCATYKFSSLNKYLSYMTGSLQLVIWAQNPEKCEDLYNAFESVWDNQVIAKSGVKVNLISNGDPTDVYDPDSKMCRLIGNFSFRAIDTNA